MRRLLNPTVLVISAILLVVYGYVAWRLGTTSEVRWALALPFVAIWLVPVVYWVFERESTSWLDDVLHAVAYLCMGWVSFLIVLTAARDVLLGATSLFAATAAAYGVVSAFSEPWVFVGAFAALGIGAVSALRGPSVRHVDIPIEGLDARLANLRIALISDLHVGPIIGARYVRRVVRLANALAPDLIALTGDIVDGSVARLAQDVAPLADLRPMDKAYLVLGNHDYYSGAAPWTAQFRSMGLRVLLNEHVVIERGGARFLIGGVTDPAARRSDSSQGPRPDRAAAPAEGPMFRLLLAHNPGLAPAAAKAGFDLQLSGHTHAGQFFPWTLAVRLVHANHAAGLSREGRMWVYVSAGTGSWGPPVRFGTEPELTLIRLVPAA
ncbi:MAG TPA: metallophosphoesterase [Burkholderiaceae bacterium]|nr:metallophosphoesterase [Burkholderiaceae bacterium]